MSHSGSGLQDDNHMTKTLITIFISYTAPRTPPGVPRRAQQAGRLVAPLKPKPLRYTPHLATSNGIWITTQQPSPKQTGALDLEVEVGKCDATA